MKESYKNGLAEVYEILKFADEESLSKIPEDFKKFIEKNKSDYVSEINPNIDLAKQNLLYETKVILSVLYREYWTPEEERKKLIEFDNIELQKEKYDYDTLFKNKPNKIKETVPENYVETSLVVQESIIKKILNKIKKIFKLGVK